MPGGGLVVDKQITDALLKEWRHGDNQRKPPSPFAFTAYEAWKEGRDAPVNGTDLKNWPGVTPAQLKTCQNATIRTIEDLAAANADTIRKLGMGGVAMARRPSPICRPLENNKASEEVASLKVGWNLCLRLLTRKTVRSRICLSGLKMRPRNVVGQEKRNRCRF
jgi:hypothetical protein